MKRSFYVFLVSILVFSILSIPVSPVIASSASFGLQAEAGDGQVQLNWDILNNEDASTILFVGTGVDADDKTIKHLESNGYNVDFIKDNEVTSEDAIGYDLVFIGESSNSSNINTKFMETEIPVVYAEPYALDDVYLSEIESGKFGSYGDQTSIHVVDSDHQLATDLQGEVEVYSQEGNVNFGTPGEDADVIATAADNEDLATIFAYEKGAHNINGDPVPERRVSTFLFAGQEDYMTSEGWQLIDEAVKWALGESDDSIHILFVGNGTEPDFKTIDRIESIGYGQLKLDHQLDNEFISEDAEGYDLVFIGESSNSSNIGDKLKDAEIPVVYAEPYALDDVDLTSKNSGEFGSFEDQTHLNIVNNNHSLAAELSGETEVYTQSGKVNFGIPSDDATVIATLTEDETRATIFAYEKGAKDVEGNPVPAKRVSTFLFAGQEDFTTDEGWSLIEESILWALDIDRDELAPETTYSIKRSTQSDGPFETIATGIADNKFTDDEVDNGVTYYYSVSTEEETSEVVSALPMEPLPNPANVTAQGFHEKVTLDWEAVTDATSYTVKRSLEQGGDFKVVAEGVTETTYTDENLVNGTEYFYIIQAVSDKTESVDGEAISAIPKDTRPVITIDQDSRYVSDPDFEITGKVDKKAAVEVNGEAVELDQDFSFQTSVSLELGENHILIEAVDEDGEKAEPIELHVTYDIKNPSLNLNEIEGEKRGNAYQSIFNPYPVSGQLSEPGTVVVNDQEVKVQGSDLNFYVEVELEPGMNDITVKGFDLAGNPSNTESFQVISKGNAVPPGPVEIISTVVTDPNTIEITFNSKLDHLDLNDLELLSAMGDWEEQNPKLTQNLSIKNTKMRINNEKQTVVEVETNETIHMDGTIDREKTEDPHRVPFLKASYYSNDLEESIKQADHLLTWQMDHGGWYKNWSDTKYTREWDGQEPKSDQFTFENGELGTIDNNATTNEILFLALMYKETGYVRYKESALKGIDYLLEAQYNTGGWPQVYPLSGGYHDYATYNDNAMIRVMNVLQMVANKEYPFNTDLVHDDLIVASNEALDLGLDYILQSQIEVDGKLTAWGQQHDPETYQPREARSFEHPSISGMESADIVQYLMALPNQTEEVQTAINAALDWYEEAKIEGVRYVSGDPNNTYFYEDSESTIWYRFYQIGTNKPIFSGRDGIIKHDIMEIEEERRNGYQWAGEYGKDILEISQTTGYYEDRAYIRVVDNQSYNTADQTLEVGALHRIEEAKK
ncbi:pectate lyase [Gracilibacillus sp. YIM 98692]|uniref:pectate lyase n=1 Tax=Gracilibacillus sp. YIM 98692 TaxID=2663532 RepID=UPI0013D23881|nr:pectate lyase [Gracilibacillus sp. YIM 98692]